MHDKLQVCYGAAILRRKSCHYGWGKGAAASVFRGVRLRLIRVVSNTARPVTASVWWARSIMTKTLRPVAPTLAGRVYH